MQLADLEDWKRWREQGCTRLPALRVHEDMPPPASWAGFADAPVSALLESAAPGRYSYLCDRPARVVLGEAAGAELWSGDGANRLGWRAGEPLKVLASLLAERKTPVPVGWPPLTGGFIGALSYDLVHTWECLTHRARRDVPVPLYAMLETGELFVMDHFERRLGIVVWVDVPAELDEPLLEATYTQAQAAADRAFARWCERSGNGAGGGRREAGGEGRGEGVRRQESGGFRQDLGEPGAGRAGARERRTSVVAGEVRRESEGSEASFSPEGFQDAVRAVKEYIAAGDTYQVNLSRRCSEPAPAEAAAIYEALRRVNPSPYMGLLRLPKLALVCGSPELLVKLVERRLVSRPIAGTRPRGAESAHDSRLSTELLANEKERAEHLMLVDLIRNDIGRVADYGSVNVREFMGVERYSHVMHLVSEVEGRLAAGLTWTDAVRSMFPGGTITGCPKIRTMEIIEELEPVGRGFYTGSLGWIGYQGDLELNIIIRSLLVQGGCVHVQSGAGIVADSQPERELDEVRRKAQALWVALHASRSGESKPAASRRVERSATGATSEPISAADGKAPAQSGPAVGVR